MHERILAIPLIRTGGHPSAERRALQRRVHRGELAAIRPGVLVEPGHLDGLRPEDQHLLLVRATAPGIKCPVELSHRSAAAVHGLPFVGPPPDKVEVVDPRRTRGETSAFLRVRAAPEDASGAPGSWSGLPPTTPISFGGADATSLVRTLIHVASTLQLVESLPMIDAALHERRVLPEMLETALTPTAWKGREKAAVAIAMGSARSDSPAESIFRVRLRQIGAPEPVQQHPFARPGERTAVVDFWFPDHGVVVEVDGRAKYEDQAMLNGRTPAEAHWHEKRREDFIRSFPEVHAVVRLSWADLMDADRVRAALVRAGVPCR